MKSILHVIQKQEQHTLTCWVKVFHHLHNWTQTEDPPGPSAPAGLDSQVNHLTWEKWWWRLYGEDFAAVFYLLHICVCNETFRRT